MWSRNHKMAGEKRLGGLVEGGDFLRRDSSRKSCGGFQGGAETDGNRQVGADRAERFRVRLRDTQDRGSKAVKHTELQAAFLLLLLK